MSSLCLRSSVNFQLTVVSFPPSRLWLGLTLSLSWTAVLTTYVIWRLDWEAGAEEARIRMGGAKRDEEEQSEI